MLCTVAADISLVIYIINCKIAGRVENCVYVMRSLLPRGHKSIGNRLAI